jgi:elongation factor G
MTFPEPVVSVSIEPKTQADQDKLNEALARLAEEDPTFLIKQDAETGQTIISGMGELHLEILTDRLIREFHVAASVGRPSVAYKETVTKSVEAAGRYVRQTGGRGHYAEVKIRVQPVAEGIESIFDNKIVGGAIPKQYIPSIERGVREALSSGVRMGYPLIGVRCELIDGAFHEVDSGDDDFRVAGYMALQEGAKRAGPVLLEPIMDVEVVTPEAYMGAVVGDLNTRRGKINGMVPRGDVTVIAVTVPLSEMFGYANTLRNLSQGRAVFSMEFSKYLPVPEEVSQKIFEHV